MATLTGHLVAETYKALLKMIDNDILTASEKQISDGLGGGTNVFIDQNGFLRANKYKVTGATASQFLKGDGSLDSNAYLLVGTTTTSIPEGTNLYFTTNRVLATLLTGFAPVSGTVTATDSILTAINKIWWNILNGGGGGGGGYVPYLGALQSVNLGEWGIKADYLEVAETPIEPVDVRKIVWNAIDGTFDMGLLNGVTLQAGQEMHFFGKANGVINNGDAVMFAGSEGDHLLMAQADPSVINVNPEYFIGIATQDFDTNDFGYVTVFGKVRTLNTSGYTLPTVLWFNSGSIIPGALTTVEPTAPNVKIRVAAVVRIHATQGSIMVRPDIAPKLSNLSDVMITDVADQDIIIWDGINDRWNNQNVFAAINATDVGKSFLSIPDALDVDPVVTKARWTRINVDNTVDAVEALDMGFMPYFRDTELFAKSPIYTTGAIVGIGTTSPTALLHLKGTTAYTELKLDNNSPTGGGMFIAQQNGNQTALFGADAYYQANTSLDAAVVAKRTGGGIQFYTNGSQSEKMGINADGNVFVGQTPTYTSSATNFIVRGKTGAGHIGVMHYDMSIKGIFNTFNSLVQIGSTTFHSLAFIVDAVERGRINSSGRFLWNTTTDNGVDDVQINGSLIATSLKKSGGTSAQYLMADGSVSLGPSLAGYVPTSRTLTINGTGYDLSADRSWSVGTVTSVDASVPTGFAISGNPITSSGTLAITFVAGYSLPTTAKQTEWDSAYTWVSAFPSQTGNAGKFLTTDGTNISWSNVVLGVTSFNTRTGAITLLSADVTGALGYTPVTNARTLSINGTAYDLSADRSWTITPGSGMRNVQTFTATSGQTTFTITGGYTAGLIDVYVNGTRLSTSDYTATNGTSVVLGVGVVTNDIVDIVAYTASATSGITGSGTANYIAKWSGTSAIANSLIYESSSSIGIGTITPNAYDPSGNNLVVYEAGNAGITIATGATNFGSLFFARGSGSADAYRGYIEYGQSADYMAFGTVSAERVRITSTGNVGIGTTSPNGLLHILSSTAYASAYIGNTGTTGGGGLLLQQNGSTKGGIGVSGWWEGNTSNDLGVFAETGGNIRFYTNGSATEKMRITSGGKILIGTSSSFSNEQMRVVGSASFGGTAIFENNQNQLDVNHGTINIVNTRTTYAIGNDASIMFSAYNSAMSMQPRASIGMKVSSDLGGELVFNTRNNSGYAERMRIKENGIINFANVPTSSAGLSSGDVYRIGATLMIV